MHAALGYRLGTETAHPSHARGQRGFLALGKGPDQRHLRRRVDHARVEQPLAAAMHPGRGAGGPHCRQHTAGIQAQVVGDRLQARAVEQQLAVGLACLYRAAARVQGRLIGGHVQGLGGHVHRGPVVRGTFARRAQFGAHAKAGRVAMAGGQQADLQINAALLLQANAAQYAQVADLVDPPAGPLGGGRLRHYLQRDGRRKHRCLVDQVFGQVRVAPRVHVAKQDALALGSGLTVHRVQQ